MVTVEERIRILTMVQDGKITAEEAARLIEAVDGVSQAGNEVKQGSKSKAPVDLSGRWFHVRITNAVNGKTRVNVRLPVGLVNAGMKMGARFSPEIEKLDMDQLLQFINSGEKGQIVEIFDQEDGDHVEVFIE